MKRLTGLVLALVILLTFAGCGAEEKVEQAEIRKVTVYFYSGDPGHRRIELDVASNTKTVTDYDVDVLDENVYEFEAEGFLPFVNEKVLPTLAEGTTLEADEEIVLWSVMVETPEGRFYAQAKDENDAYPDYWETLIEFVNN